MLRARRRAIPPPERKQASRSLLESLRRVPRFLNANRVAFYLANDGELDIDTLR